MIINRFADGRRDKKLVYASNGTQEIQYKIPRGAIVRSATCHLELIERPDQAVRRIGVVNNISLEELNHLEEVLEQTSWGKQAAADGWSIERKTKFIVGEAGNYSVIPIDPSTMITAHPAYYKREYDAIFIPDGPLNVDLTNLITSGLPIITNNPSVAQKLGIASEVSLKAGIIYMRVVEPDNYVNHDFEAERVRVGGPINDQSSHIKVNAMDVGDFGANVILDTGERGQGVVISAVNRKHIYIGFQKLEQVLSDNKIYLTFKRALEWCSVGGWIVDLTVDINDRPADWELTDEEERYHEVEDFSEQLNDYLESGDAVTDDQGYHTIKMAFTSSSPGTVIVTRLNIECYFIMTITRFPDQEESTVLQFEESQRQIANIEVPRIATVRSAKVQVSGAFSNERVAIASSDESDVHGALISPQIMVAQEVRSDINLTISRVAVHLAKIENDSELIAQICEGDAGRPMRNVLGEVELGSNDIPSSYRWLDLDFDNLVLKKDTSYWLVFQAPKGKVNWHADIKKPCGGMLLYSKDDGVNWMNHYMDGLFKVFHELEAYDTSPNLMLGGSKGLKWSFSGRFDDTFELIDFTNELNNYIATAADKTKETVEMPLIFTTESIGELILSALEIECEVPNLDLSEDVEEDISEQLASLLKMLELLEVKVREVLDNMSEEEREQLEPELERLGALAEPSEPEEDIPVLKVGK